MIRLAAFLVLAGLLGPSPASAAHPEPTPNSGAAKVVFDLTTGDLKQFEDRTLKLIPTLRAHYAEQKRGLDAVVVVHGDAYRFFLESLKGTPYADDKAVAAEGPRLKKALAALSETGVRFELCLAGMKKRDLDPANAYAFAYRVPNAYIALIDWQNRGYAWAPIH